MSPQIQRGISLIILPLPSERGRGRGCTGVCSGFFWEMFRLYEIPLQTVRCYCSQINSLSLKTAFVTYRESISYKEGCKRCPFASQNMPFYTSKDALLHCKRASFTTQKGMYYLPTVNSLYIRWESLRMNKLIIQQVHCTIPHIQRHPFTSPSLFFRG